MVNTGTINCLDDTLPREYQSSSQGAEVMGSRLDNSDSRINQSKNKLFLTVL